MKNSIDFDDITKELAEILKQKNKAYGNSFDKTMDKWGMTPLGIRLDDKIGRIDNMLQEGILSENGESLLDNLFDLAGYSVLAIRYLVANRKLLPSDIKKYFDDYDDESEDKPVYDREDKEWI